MWRTGALVAEEWSYHRLCEAYREEKGTNRLAPLAPDFSRSVQELISRLSTQPEGQKELENARKQVRLLTRLRRRKLMMLASMESEGAEPEGLTEGEKEMYGRLRQMYAQEDERLEGMMHPLPASGERTEVKEANGGINGGSAAAPLKKLRFLQDVPQYRGADAVPYGPFSAKQEAELPESEAAALISGNMACEIGPNGENVIYVTQAVKILKVYMEDNIPQYESPQGQKIGPFKKGERVMLPEPEARHLIRLKLGMESD